MKKLNTNSITNELESSSFFPGRPAQQDGVEESEKKPAPGRPAVLEPAQAVAPQLVETQRKEPTRKPVAKSDSLASTAKGRYARRTFDIFAHQLAYLTRESLQERLDGGEGSMNAMVREALDAFIGQQKKR